MPDDPIAAAQKVRIEQGGKIDKAILRESEAKKKGIYVPRALYLKPKATVYVDLTKPKPIVRT